MQYDTLGRVGSRGGCIDFAFPRTKRDGITVVELKNQSLMQKALNKARNMRSMCRTRKEYIGHIPASAIVDDWIYVLLGGQVLYVLRTCNSGDRNATYSTLVSVMCTG